ncbi:MAG: hypothetical protein KC431_07165 [Myxococcales bacterium]|nr:hypothetical protein [Myxococcales bacterium]MCA9697287.1 hypothetical protein [Myxococcales bacterium]
MKQVPAALVCPRVLDQRGASAVIDQRGSGVRATAQHEAEQTGEREAE